MSKITVAVTVDLAEFAGDDPTIPVSEAVFRAAAGIKANDTAGQDRASVWEISLPDGSPVLSLDAVIERYLDLDAVGV